MLSKSKRRSLVIMLFASYLAVLVLAPKNSSAQQQANGIAQKVRDIFSQRCFQCHGQDGKAAKNIFVLDRDRLLATQIIIPKDTNSPLLKAIENGAMPLGSEELSAPEKAAIRTWILQGAVGWDEVNATGQVRQFIDETSLTNDIRDDLTKSSPRSRPFLRYFSLAHLYNAGSSDAELSVYSVGLAKLINSLSWQREITLPLPINATQTLYRIDLRDYQWSIEQWQKVLTLYPYRLISTVQAEQIKLLSGESLPYIRADWFVAKAATPPLYHEILNLPLTLKALEQRLGIETARHLVEEKNVLLAGVRTSGVSQNNRVLERHTSPFGAYWRSYDFKSNLGNQNIFADPLSLNAAGGEIIFNLPNGLQAYFLTDGVGRRIETAPVDIVADRNQPDNPIVRNGRSCMSCHFAGIKTFQDDVRPMLFKTTAVRFNYQRALALYVPQNELNQAFALDEDRFRQAEKLITKQPTNNANTEAVNALARRFEAELSIAQAAAEVGLRPANFQVQLQTNRRLTTLGLGQLLAVNGGVKRDIWEQHFSDVVRELGLGLTAENVSQIRWNRANSSPTFLTENDPKELLSAARTAFIRSDTIHLPATIMSNTLQNQAGFQKLAINTTVNSQTADIIIIIDHVFLTFDYTYQVQHRQTSKILCSGNVTAFDGNLAAPKIAALLTEKIQDARGN